MKRWYVEYDFHADGRAEWTKIFKTEKEAVEFAKTVDGVVGWMEEIIFN